MDSEVLSKMDNSYIVIFDGVCNFCNGGVNFIIKRDPDAKFVFTPMQSDLAKELMLKYQIDNVGMDTFVLIKGDESYIFSSAALEITKDLEGLWWLFLVFKIVPVQIRDYFYKLFARNRYTLFGRKELCMVPTSDIRSRFLGV